MEHITVASPPKEPGVPESSTLEWAKREGKSLTRMEISVPPQTVTARELIPKTSPSPPSSTSSISSSDTDKKHISHGLGSTNSPLRKSHSYLLRRGFNSKEAFEMLKVLPGNGHYAGAGEDAEKEYIELKIGAMADMYDEFTEKLNNEFEHFSESHKDMADQLFKSRIVWINYRHKHSPEKYPVGQCYTEKLLEREKIYTEIDHEHYGGFGAEKKKAESSRQWGQEILGKTKVPRSPEMPDTFDNETGSYLRESPKDSVRRGEWAKTETPYPFAKPPVQQRQYSVEDPFMQTRNLSPPNSSPSIVVSNAFLRDVIAETTDFELKSIAIDAQFPDFSADDRRVALKHLAKIWKDLDKIPSNRLLEEMLSLKEELYQRLDAHRRQGRQAEKDRETERSLDSWRAQVAETEKMRRRFIMVGLAVAGMAVVVACISPEMAIFLMVFLAAGAWFRCGGVMRP